MSDDAQAGSAPVEVKLGTLTGVFAPTVLTILGAIMYLRAGWTVGNAGLGGAILIILLAHVITITTGLAVSSIATNIRVGAGGAFAIIAQSLGLEAGGSIGVPLYLAQSVSVTLYLLAFTEGWLRIYPEHPEALVALVAFAIVMGVTLISTTFAARSQLFILGVVVFSLVAVAGGSVPIEGVQDGMVHTPVLWGAFEDATFFETFAIFFPAVTGIMAGISMSGVLRDPRRSIPKGTLSGIAITMAIYLVLAYWLARVATPAELVENKTIMVDRAYWDWAVLAGLLAATFSSALGSVLAAPQVMQALGMATILPWSPFFAAKTRRDEPRNAILVTGGIILVTLVIALLGGGLDFVAPLITMFFLLTYAMLNLVVLTEQTLDMVSFRPTFRVPRMVPLVGFVSCTAVAFLVNPVFSLVSCVFAIAIYWVLLRRKLPGVETGDVRSGLFLSLARWGAERVATIPAAPERTWLPSILAPVSSSSELMGSYRFLRALARRGEVHCLGVHPPDERKTVDGLRNLVKDFNGEGIHATATLVEEADFFRGTFAAMDVFSATYFRPKLLFLRLLPDRDLGDDLKRLAKRVQEQRMGMILLSPHPVTEFGREKQINVWVRDQGPAWELGLRLSNLDLSLLLAYELARCWGGHVLLCMAVPDEETRATAEEFLSNLIELARLGAWAQHNVLVCSFDEALQQVPRGDVTFLGFPADPNVQSIQALTSKVDGSCLLVRDSGDESVLA